MSIQHQAVPGPLHVVIDVVGGAYRIATQSLSEILVDARQTHNKTLIPGLHVHGNVARLVKQPLLRWFATKSGVDATVLIPEGSSINVKMYSGSLIISGAFKSIDVNMRSGDVLINGPGFSISNDSAVRIGSGTLRCVGLLEGGFEIPLVQKKITQLTHQSGATLHVNLQLGELDFS